MVSCAIQVEEYGHRGIRCMAVARTDAEGQWYMLGLLTFLDPPRPDTKATLETALHYGVQTRMVSSPALDGCRCFCVAVLLGS